MGEYIREFIGFILISGICEFYFYFLDCNNVREVEKYRFILCSGREGYYG